MRKANAERIFDRYAMPPDSSHIYRPNPPCRGLRSGSGYEENIMKKQRKSV